MAASRSSRQQPPEAAAHARYSTDNDEQNSNSRFGSHSTHTTPRRSSSRSHISSPPLSPLYTPLHIQTNSPTASSSASSLYQRRSLLSLSPDAGRPLSGKAFGRPLKLLSVSVTLLLLLLLVIVTATLAYFYRVALSPPSFLSLIPFLSLPPPSLAIVSLLTTLPPPSHLTSTDLKARHTALITHATITAYLHLTPPSHILLVAPTTDVCTTLSLWGRRWRDFGAVGCRTAPQDCVNNTYGGDAMVVECVMGLVKGWLAGVAADYVVVVSPGVVLAPHLTATLAALAYPPHASNAQLSPTAALVLTSHSTNVVVSPQLSDLMQTSNTAEQQYTALLGAANQAATSQVVVPPPRTRIDLLILPCVLLRAISFPPLLLSDVEAEEAVWRQWLLYKLYTHRHAQVVDATQLDDPLLFRIPPSQPSSSIPTNNTTTALLAHNQQVANAHNPRLTWQFGQVDHAPFTVRGRCPNACRVIPSSSPLSQLLNLLLHRTSMSNYIMVVVVDEPVGSAVDDDVEVFLCWSRRVKFDAWLMAVRSTATAERLKERGVAAVSFEGDTQKSTAKSEAGAAGREVEFKLWLNELVARILSYNVNVMLTNTAIIPLSSAPFSRLQPVTNHHLVASSSSLDPSSSLSSAVSSIVVLVASAASINHLSTERECLVDAAASQSTAVNGWMSCTKLIDGSVALPSNSFTGLDDYTSRRPSMRGHIPLLIHTATSNTHIKPQLLQQWGLAPSRPTHCILESHTDSLPSRQQPAAAAAVSGAAVVLQVRVLTYDRTASLRRLLQSLSEVDWHWTPHATAASTVSTIHIHFIISIDVPALPSPTTASATAAAASIANDWCTATELHWPSLSPFSISCTTLVQPRHLGLVGQWTEISSTEGGGSGSDGEDVVVVLEDDVIVTRVFFRVVMDQLVRFHYQSYNPRLVTLALQHPATIVGETDSHPYGALQPAAVALADCMNRSSSSGSDTAVEQRRCYFYYQLIGTWGAVFLPGQYAAFSRWLHAADRNFSYLTGESTTGLPCVPSLLSNAWWQRRHDAVWSVWIIRYMYEYGLYSLYSASALTASSNTSTHNNDSVIVNMREVGENFKQKRGATNTPLLDWTAADVNHLYTGVRLPSEVKDELQESGMDGMDGVSVLSLYDFHFRKIESYDIDSLRYRSTILPATQFDQCWTRADWKKHKSAIPNATVAAG